MVVEHHLRMGWAEAAAGWSLDLPGQFCRQLVWAPR